MLLTKLYNNISPEKKCLHFPLPVTMTVILKNKTIPNQTLS